MTLSKPHEQVAVLSEPDLGVWRNSDVLHSFYIGGSKHI